MPEGTELAKRRLALRVRGRSDLERGAGSVRPDEPPIPERVVVRLPIQDLTHLMRHAVRISVEHGKQIGSLGGRSIAGQLAFQLLPALPRGPPRRSIRTEKKHPRRKSRWDLPARSCLGHGCLPAGVARCCSSTLHRPDASQRPVRPGPTAATQVVPSTSSRSGDTDHARSTASRSAV